MRPHNWRLHRRVHRAWVKRKDHQHGSSIKYANAVVARGVEGLEDDLEQREQQVNWNFRLFVEVGFSLQHFPLSP